METVRKKLELMLIERGMYEDEATAVMDIVVKQVDDKWDLPAVHYPNEFYAAMFLSYVNPAALEWIDKNAPDAWYRDMFALK